MNTTVPSSWRLAGAAPAHQAQGLSRSGASDTSTRPCRPTNMGPLRSKFRGGTVPGNAGGSGGTKLRSPPEPPRVWRNECRRAATSHSIPLCQLLSHCSPNVALLGWTKGWRKDAAAWPVDCTTLLQGALGPARLRHQNVTPDRFWHSCLRSFD